MITIGLTGSIGMGKTTTAGMFAREGVAVCDADALVHVLYRGEAVPAVERAFPGVSQGGVIDREKLSAILRADPERFSELEAIVHPLVKRKRRAFLEEKQREGQEIVLFDIPLLFETGADDEVDATVVASCPPRIQRDRVLSRPGMTPEKFAAILARQMPDEEKRARADFVVETGGGFDDAAAQVRGILEALRKRPQGNARNA